MEKLKKIPDIIGDWNTTGTSVFTHVAWSVLQKYISVLVKRILCDQQRKYRLNTDSDGCVGWCCLLVSPLWVQVGGDVRERNGSEWRQKLDIVNATQIIKHI